MMPPILIGLTGGIGTGKSSVAKLLSARGAKVVSGDELGRIALEKSPALLAVVRSRFGDGVFAPDGKLLRRELGRQVFASTEHAHWLTRLTFPAIYDLWYDAVRTAKERVIVFDAALIMEWGIEREFDYVIAVTAAPETVRRRLQTGGRLSESETRSRQASQFVPRDGVALADYVIDNNGTPAALAEQVDRFWQMEIQPKLQQRKTEENA